MENNEFEPFSQNTSFDIRTYTLKLLAYWYLFAISLPLAYTVAYFQNRYATPIYGVHSTIVFSRNDAQPALLAGGLKLTGRKNLANEKSILRSYTMAERTLAELSFDISYYTEGRFRNVELYKTAPFIVLKSSDRLYQPIGKKVFIKLIDEQEYELRIGENKYKLAFGETFAKEGFKFSIIRRGLVPLNTKILFYFQFNNMNSMINAYSNKLKISDATQGGSILWMWIQGPIPQKEADYLNKLIDVYIRYGLEEKNKIAVNTMRFIDKQMKSIVDSLRRSENKLYSFRQSNTGVDFSERSGILFEKTQEIEANIKTQELYLNYYNYLKEKIQKNQELKYFIPPTAMGISDEALTRLLARISELTEERDKLGYSVKSGLPSMELLEKKIQNTYKTLEITIDNNIQAIKVNIERYRSEADQIYLEIQKLPAKERQMMNIKRGFNLNNNLYNMLLEKKTEVGITLASNKSDVKVLDKCRPANARTLAPNKSRTTSRAIMLGLIAPLVIIAIREFLNTKILDKSDIERRTKIPVIGAIGRNPTKHEIPVFNSPKSSITESFRAIRTNLKYILRDQSGRVIAVTSTVSGEGKSFCSLNLAATIATSNHKTLIVGLDLRKPKLHRPLGWRNRIGVTTFLAGRNTWEEVIQPSEIPNLDVALAGPIPPNPAELLESIEMENFLIKASRNYEYVVLDTPPVAAVTDTMLLNKFSNATIYVMRQNYTDKSAIKLVNETASRHDLKHLSILLNDVVYSRHYGFKYGYGYNYGYGYGMGYYEDEPEESSWWKRLLGR